LIDLYVGLSQLSTWFPLKFGRQDASDVDAAATAEQQL